MSTAPAAAAPDDGPPAAAAVLDRFLGAWETETWIRRVAAPPRETHTKGRADCQRTLAGRYVEFRSRSAPAAYAELQIMTYDPDSGRFLQWVFDSDGYRHAAVDTWDAPAQRLRWEGRDGTGTFVIDDQWRSPDRLEWTLTRVDAAGQQTQSIRGVVQRATRP